MKTFLVSLERATARRRKIIQDLDNLSWDYEIFDAVDGNQLSEVEIEKHCDMEFLENNRWWFPNGMIGCCLSHFHIYNEIIKRDLDYAFIIEDDAKLTKDLPILIDQCEKEIKKNEVILVYYQSGKNLCKISKKNKVKLFKKFHLHYPYEAKSLCSTGAYIITKEACQQLVNFILPIRRGPDDWSSYYENCLDSIRVIYPRPMDTYDYRSTITNLDDTTGGSLAKAIHFIDNYKIPVLNQLLAIRRKYNKTYKDSKFELTNEKSLVSNDQT